MYKKLIFFWQWNLFFTDAVAEYVNTFYWVFEIFIGKGLVFISVNMILFVKLAILKYLLLLTKVFT